MRVLTGRSVKAIPVEEEKEMSAGPIGHIIQTWIHEARSTSFFYLIFP